MVVIRAVGRCRRMTFLQLRGVEPVCLGPWNDGRFQAFRAGFVRTTGNPAKAVTTAGTHI